MLLFRFGNKSYSFLPTFSLFYSAVHTLYIYYNIVKALNQRTKVLMSVTNTTQSYCHGEKVYNFKIHMEFAEPTNMKGLSKDHRK